MRNKKQTGSTAAATTPLTLFIETLGSVKELQGSNDTGMDAIRAQMRAILPYLPTLILTGTWADFTENTVHDTFDAAAKAHARVAPPDPDEPNEAMFLEHEARYWTGVLVGLSLAHALQGSKGEL